MRWRLFALPEEVTRLTVIRLFSVLLLTTTAGAQQFVVPTLTLLGESEKPARWLDNVTKPIIVVYAKGHWVAALDKKTDIAGFAVSEISCSKPEAVKCIVLPRGIPTWETAATKIRSKKSSSQDARLDSGPRDQSRTARASGMG